MTFDETFDLSFDLLSIHEFSVKTFFVVLKCFRFQFSSNFSKIKLSKTETERQLTLPVEVSDEANQILSLNSKQTEDEQGN